MKKRLVPHLYRVIVCCMLLAGSLQCFAQESEPDSVAGWDKTSKSILDSSERFFYSRSAQEPFTYEQKVSPLIAKKKVDDIRKADEFWYINGIDSAKKAAEQKVISQIDSLMKQNGGKPQRMSEESLNDPGSSFLGGIGNMLFWGIIIVVFGGAIIYFLASNKVGFWAPGNKSITGRQMETDMFDENIFALPYKELLDKAYKEGNFRLAVRILYLQTLKMMSERHLINFQPEYTNIHYLMQLSNTDYHKDFSVITRHYEYVWYGKFSLSKEQYDKLSSDFNNIQKRIK